MDSTAVIIVTAENWPLVAAVVGGIVAISVLINVAKDNESHAMAARDAAIDPAVQAILDGWRDDHFTAIGAGVPCPVEKCYYCYVGTLADPSTKPCTCSPYQACTCPIVATT